jgi:Carbohydrate binding module (family 35)/Carbohydrate binding module (family 6)
VLTLFSGIAQATSLSCIPAVCASLLRTRHLALVCGLILLTGSFTSASAQSQLTINVNSDNGAILHGASGWLYGQSELDLPSQNLMAPLKPRYSAGKPPQGLQHAGGDVTQITPSYLSSGGVGMQIYLQDIFSTFYPNPGISSYTSTVQGIVNSLKSNPNFNDFIYVPFNEPDGEVYGQYGTGITNLSGFESDWVTIFNAIRAINPSAQIAGPNFYLYDNNAYTSWLTYAKAHNAVPNQISWHELTNNTYSDWYTEYNDYRAIEKSLGISPLPIVINEYAQSAQMGVPGQLVQYIARFENSRVYGCLAYWTPDGDLGYLGASAQPNVPTGGWWLYQWYGEMAGNTLSVTPPNLNAQGLQGVAALDANTHQIKAIFGGTSGTVNVTIQNLSSQSYLASKVHVTVWGVDSTGSTGTPTGGPYYIQEGDYTESNGDITVAVPNTQTNSAYYLIVTPAKSTSSVNSSSRHEAEYADLFGPATVTYGSNTGYSGTYFVQGYGNNNGAITEFDVQAPSSGFYNLDLRYSAPNGNSSLNLYLNGPELETVSLPVTENANTWSDNTVTVYLTGGINRIAYGSNGSSEGVQLDYLNVSSTSGTATTYEATSSSNTLGGTAVRQNNSSAPGGTQVGYVGQGSANYLQFNNVNVPSSGLYRMTVEYANDEVYTDPEGGPVFRFAQISVNGGAAAQVYFDNTYSWNTFEPIEIDVQLNAGNNTIRFSNSTTSPSPNIDSGWVPVIATIQIASAE